MTMTVYASTTKAKILGVVVLFLSVLLTWYCTSYLRNRANRAQLLLPVSAAVKTLEALQAVTARAPKGLFPQHISNIAKQIITELSEADLASNKLPSKFPVLGAASDPASIDLYRQYVQKRIDWVQPLRILVHEGLEPAWTTFQSGDSDAKDRAAVAAKAIDALAMASTAPDIDATRSSVQRLVSVMNTPAIHEESVVSTAAIISFFARAPAVVESPQRLLLSINSANLFGWLFLLLVTTLGGAYIFVLGPNGPGFGTTTDFVLCALWGFGLPVGAQLMQATTGSIATSFK